MSQNAENLYQQSKGFLYAENAEGIHDIELAKKLCKMAADMGHEDAQVDWATALIYGTYGEKNVEKGFEQLRQLVADHPENQSVIETLEFLTDEINEDLQDIIDN